MSTYPDYLVFCARRQIPPVWAEADATNVQVAIFRQRAVLEVGNKFAVGNVEDLGSAIATGGDKPPVVTESDTADHTLMVKRMN